jgi:hypothetical protein
MSTINYSEKIPNNVNLSEDRTLQRALVEPAPHPAQTRFQSNCGLCPVP